MPRAALSLLSAAAVLCLVVPVPCAAAISGTGPAEGPLARPDPFAAEAENRASKVEDTASHSSTKVEDTARLSSAEADDNLGSVIFIHPDGASAATWAATRMLLVGPDGDLEWDKLPHIAVYRGHMRDSLTGTSNGGATTHATGEKVFASAYGRSAGGGEGDPLVDDRGRPLSIAEQALEAGLRVGLVQTGIASEPGTGAFLAEAASRRDHEGIAQQLVESGAHVLFSGGEKYFLPEGTDGTHGPGARTDGQNLVHRARDLGYTVVRTRSELLTLPAGTTRVLGLFAHDATFNEMPEEDLRERGLSAFDDAAPTVAEMTEAALRVLGSPEPGSANTAPRRFLLVVEEEATDNFGNNNNAAGVLEAAARADAAIGVARRHLAANPSTLILTCADSDGGGLRPIGVWPDDQGRLPEALPAQGSNGAPIDGVGGTGTAPFIAAPDRFGNRLAFAIAWASRNDLSGGILARAQGLHAERVRGSFDNTQVAELARLVLFGDQRGPVHAQGQPPADQ